MAARAGRERYTVRILHVSDLHERQGPAGNDALAKRRGGETWRRRQVLGDAWRKNLDDILEEGPVDLVCFTGDVADWGLAEEYAAVTDFVLEMLASPRRSGSTRHSASVMGDVTAWSSPASSLWKIGLVRGA